MNKQLLEAVKEAVITEERSMRGIDLGSPLWGQRIAQAAIAAHSAFIREAINAEIDTWEQVPMRGATKRKIAKVLDQIERTPDEG